MVACILVAISLGIPGRPSGIEIPAQPLPAAVRAAGKAFGENWDAAPALDRVCLLIHAPEASSAEVKTKIAAAEHGTWAAAAGNSLLSRSKESQKGLRDEEQARLLAAIRAGIEKDAALVPFTPKDVSSNVKLIAEQMRLNQLNNGAIAALIRMLPANSYVRNGLHNLSPADLCVGPGNRVVFSSKPNRLQRQLPDQGGLFAAYSRDLDKMRSYVPVADRKGRTEDTETVIPALDVFSSREAVARLCLSIQRVSQGTAADSLTAAFSAVGSSGNVLDQGYLRIPIVAKAKIPDALLSSMKPVAVEQANTILVGYLGGRALAPAENNPAVEFVSSGTDPLAGLPSRLLRAIADAEGLKLIAVLPDSAFDVWKHLPVKGDSDVRTLVQAFADTGAVDFQIEDGWLIVTPVYPVEAQTQFVDRGSLKKLLTTVDRGERFNGSDLAQFFAGNPEVANWYPLTTLMTSFWGFDLGMTAPEREAPWLRFYAATADVFAKSPEGTVTFDRLSKAQTDAFADALLAGSGFGPQAGQPYAGAEPTEQAADVRSGEMNWRLFKYPYLAFFGEGSARTEISLSALVEIENDVESVGAYVDPAWRPKIKSRAYTGVQAQSRNDLTVHIKLGAQEVKYLRVLDAYKVGPVAKSLDLLPAETAKELENMRRRGQPPPDR